VPDEFTPDAIRRMPVGVLRRLSRPGNGVLTPEEQRQFNKVAHEVMRDTAERVSQRISRSDWADVRRELNTSRKKRGGPGRSDDVDRHLRRLAGRIDQAVDVAEAIAPDVDWSFALAEEPEVLPAPTRPTEPAESIDQDQPDQPDGTDDAQTVSDLEEHLTEQMELVQVMSEIADISKRTFALEEQRDLQNTRTVFFGFVVSMAVIVAGWAPLVAADWSERWWTIGLTFATAGSAALVYALIRKEQNKRETEAAD
jgi:hypothetical protein